MLMLAGLAPRRAVAPPRRQGRRQRHRARSVR
jgi:hypothetical protein